MNPPVSSARRLLAALLLLLASLGGVTAAWADGLAERGAQAAVAHVEGETGGPCAAAHDHAHCGFCRLLREAPLPDPAPSPPPVAAPAELAASESVRSAPAPSVARPGARAPPALA